MHYVGWCCCISPTRALSRTTKVLKFTCFLWSAPIPFFNYVNKALFFVWAIHNVSFVLAMNRHFCLAVYFSTFCPRPSHSYQGRTNRARVQPRHQQKSHLPNQNGQQHGARQFIYEDDQWNPCIKHFSHGLHVWSRTACDFPLHERI